MSFVQLRASRIPLLALFALLFTVACVVASAGCAAPAPDIDVPEAPLPDASVEDRYAWWEGERAARQAELTSYLAAHQVELEALLYQPLGDIGVPLSLLEQFPVVFPDIWGTPEESFAGVGLGPDLLDPSNALPLGLVRFTAAGTDFAQISCGACHVGRVVGPDGEVRLLIGAPNSQMNKIFTAFEDTVADPRWAELDTNVVDEGVRQVFLFRRSIEEKAIAGFTFDVTRHPTAPQPFARDTPGFFDSFSVIFSMQTLPEVLNPLEADQVIASVMPPAPAEADIMSLWRQRARPRAEWDGSLPHPVYRNLAAAVGAMMGVGQVLNYDASAAAAELSRDLPPPPYPFPVDSVRAESGEKLFEQHCARCHFAGASEVYPTSLTGTDPNRANAVTAEGRTRLIAALRDGCTDPAVCDVPDDSIVGALPEASERGYMALPLDGIWARAPYLHNGSVPTLYHLLVPESRPNTFVRGNIHYDTERVGFVWDAAAAEEKYTYWYDTTRAGRSNAGHTAFLGLDWAAHPEELADLLEYLKTL